MWNRSSRTVPAETSAIVLVACYCACGLTAYFHFSDWGGHEKAYLLAAYLGLIFPAAALLWRTITRAAGQRGGSLPYLADTRMVVVLCAAVLVAYAAARNRGVELGDESVYRFEARDISAGHLTVDLPPQQVLADPDGMQAFRFTHEVKFHGRWFGKYPIGFPAVLAAADSLGLDRMINPILSCFILALTALVAAELFGAVVAQWTVVALTLSAFFFFNSMGWYSHNLAGVLIAGATAAVVLSRRARPVLLLSLAGLALALCLLVRPFSAVIAGTVLAVYSLREHWRDRRSLVLGGLISTLLVAIAVGAYLFVQKQLTGNWFLSPYSVYYKAGTVPKEINLHPTSILRNLKTITGPGLADTMLSSFPLLLPVSLLVIVEWRHWEGERRRAAALLTALFWVLAAAYIVQTEPSTSPIGNRYYYETFFAAVIVAVAGFDALLQRYAARQWPQRLVLVALLAVAAVQIFIYQRISSAARLPYYEMDRAAHAIHGDNLIVYLAGSDNHFYSSWMDLNGADWEHAPVLFLRDPGPGGREKVAGMIHRDSWVVLAWKPEQQKVVTIVSRRNGARSAHNQTTSRARGEMATQPQ